jgi:hypothetical protein
MGMSDALGEQLAGIAKHPEWLVGTGELGAALPKPSGKLRAEVKGIGRFNISPEKYKNIVDLLKQKKSIDEISKSLSANPKSVRDVIRREGLNPVEHENVPDWFKKEMEQ